jgi:hypothetical protein
MKQPTSARSRTFLASACQSDLRIRAEKENSARFMLVHVDGGSSEADFYDGWLKFYHLLSHSALRQHFLALAWLCLWYPALLKALGAGFFVRTLLFFLKPLLF